MLHSAQPPTMSRANQTTTRLRIAWWLVLGAAGTLVVFLFCYRLVMHHFMTGPFLWDSGWYSYAIFQNGFLLPNPPYLRHLLGTSLFTQHLYGLVSIVSPISFWFPTHYQYFSSVVGATYSLTFSGPYLCVMALRPRERRSAALALVAVIVGLSFAFSGPVMSAMGYPHFEIAIPAFFILFLALHFLDTPLAASAKWVALAAGLLVREDAGLHYASVFAVVALYQWRTGREVLSRTILVNAGLLSFGVAVSMLFVQRHFFPLGDSMFTKSFIGNPPLAQLTLAEFMRRATTFLAHAPVIYTPMIVVGAACLILRDPIYGLAYVACLPWIAINVVFSLTPAAETLSLYYGFPLLVGLAWPLVAPHWARDTHSPERRRAERTAISVFLLATASSLAFAGNADILRKNAAAGGHLTPLIYDRERQCLGDEFRANPRMYADTTVLAMFPHTVPSRLVVNSDSEVNQADADAFIFYDRVAERFRNRASTLGLQYESTLMSPPIRLLSRNPSAFVACVEKTR